MSSSFIGKVIDNYRILESLGIGGMGVVFKAINTKLDKLVALKMIAPGLAMNDNFIKRFQKEAKALAKLADPNIVAVYDLRQENDQWYIVMEYVDGPNLIDKIKKEGALNLIDAICIIKQVLSAIGHAHEANIVHRDMKPNNIMLNSDGNVKITDFGLAKDTSISAHSMSIQSGGTLYYMSPEHIKGFSFSDKRSDIYSIGMTFYEMLSGSIPFQNMHSDFEIRETIVRKEFLRPTSFNKNIPKKLEKIVMKAIAKSPDDRYQTAYQMLEDIEEFESVYLATKSKRKKTISTHKRATQKTFFKGKELIAVAITLLIMSVIFMIQEKRSSIMTYIFDDEKVESNEIVVEDKKTEEILLEVPVKIQSQNEEKPVLKKPTQESEKTKTELLITSKPSGSKIFVAGKYVGNTPFRFADFKESLARIHLEKKGYKSIEAERNLKKGKKNSYHAELIAIVGSAIIEYMPKDAVIKIDGKTVNIISNPLYLKDLSVGSHTVEISKPGFLTFSDKIEIAEIGIQKVSTQLKELNGKLSVRIKPWGSIYIDNKIQKANTDRKYEIDLKENKYLLKVVHPTFGEWKKEINILHEKEEAVVIDFTKKVAVYVDALDENKNPVSAKIIVDNKLTDYITPERIQLHPGVHFFEIKKDGFIATEDRKEILIENNSQEAVKFILKRTE